MTTKIHFILLLIFLIPLYGCNSYYRNKIEKEYNKTFIDVNSSILFENEIEDLLSINDPELFLDSLINHFKNKSTISNYKLNSNHFYTDLSKIFDKLVSNYTFYTNDAVLNNKLIEFYIIMNIQRNYDYMMLLVSNNYYLYYGHILRFSESLTNENLRNFYKSLPTLRSTILASYKFYCNSNITQLLDFDYKMFYEMYYEINYENLKAYLNSFNPKIGDMDISLYTERNFESYYELLKLKDIY